MFDDVKNSLSNQSSGGNISETKSVEDIFSGTDQSASLRADKNVNENSNQTTTMPAAYQSFDEGRQTNRKTILVVLLGVILLGIVGVGGYMAYSFFMAKQSGEKNIETGDLLNNEKPPENQNQAVNENVIIKKNSDTDNDGLSNEEEDQFGTDLTRPDTDDDGLFDREEVYSFKTDPLNPDSDGDGFFDGAEIKSGYDPLGTGRFIDKLPIAE
jgi:hypothetical protein